MLPKNTIASKSSPPRPRTECMKQNHLLELMMLSPASTPEADHLSDVSSCCSMENTDSNRSSGPDSPINSMTDDSSSTPALDLKRKYKKQLGSAFCSDYHYLMDEQILDSCRSAKSDLSFECDEQMTRRIAVASFKEFLQQFTQLNALLKGMLQKAQTRSHCLSERYVNQVEVYLTGDIDRHLRQVNGTWMTLEKLLLPNANHSDNVKMLQDMELDFEALRQWVDDMKVKRCTWRLHSHWATNDIIRHLEVQKMLQGQIESRSRVVRVLLSLCERLMTNGDDVETVALEGLNRAAELKRQVTDLQVEIHVIWLSSLEWQMKLEDAQKKGIHLHGNRAEDNRCDRMRSTDRCKQPKEFQTTQELSSDSVNDEDSSFQSSSRCREKPDCYKGLSVKDEDSVIPVDESLTNFDDVDGSGLSGSCYSQMPGECNSQSYSSPLLMGDLCDGVTLQDDIRRNRSGRRSDLEMDLDSVSVESKAEKRENDLYRRWPSGQPRFWGATDFSAAFRGGRNDIPVDFGYSSGSHSNEETDNSAKHLFVWSHDQQSCCIDRESPNYNKKEIIRVNILNSVTGHEDGQSFPGTEDEMSVELPLDDIPVFVSSDFCAEDCGGDVPERPLAEMAAACSKKLHITEPPGTRDWSLTTANGLEASPKGRRGIKQWENDAKMPLAEKRTGEGKTKPPSGSCYTSGEGTESESDFLNRNFQIEKHERTFGRRLNLNWVGSSLLCSSPLGEGLTEIVRGRPPLEQRIIRCNENAFGDRCRMDRLSMSDSAIREPLVRNSVGPRKIPKMPLKVCEMLKSNAPVNDVHSSSKGADDLTRRHVGSDRGVFGKLKSSVDETENISSEPAGLGLHCMEFLRCEEDAVLPNCDSLNSSLATDDIQHNHSDSDVFVAKDIVQLDDVDHFGDNFKGYRIKEVKGRGMMRELAQHQGMDSDSDREDFQHVLGESRRGLKFIEATIRQECSLSENNVFSQDTTTFNESLATCTANIVCLQELMDALASKKKMDNEILQVTEMVARWQQLQSTLVALQKETQQAFRFQTEVSRIQSDLQNMRSIVECDDRFCNIRQLEAAVEAVKAVRSKLNTKTDLKLRTLDVEFKKFVCDCEDLDPRLSSIGRRVEQLKSCLESLAKRCEAKEHKLQSALISWNEYIDTQEELSRLFQLCDHSSMSGTVTELASGGAGLEEVSGLQEMKVRLKMLDEMLHQLSLVSLEFADVCSEPSALALKQAVALSSDRLQVLHQENDEKLMKLVGEKRECSLPEAVDQQMALTSDVVPSVWPLSAALPLALSFVLASCLFALFGDSWYELLGGLGLILDPVLKYIRGPPPS